ncbi:hypothetical protein RRG08_040282 [Elysia crispata]|uniref:Uncharacterized protein n=1 Tax=Elysia crispata TaxID=231223 RepID=A0AAE0Z3H3_9GAST|nr:hypothetical protein RRG08_040282 [Elysia crispata]
MENQFASPVMCTPDWWRTNMRHLCCALQIDGEPVSVTCDIDGQPPCVTCDVRSRLMENKFDVRSRLMENQFYVRSRLMENQFESPVMCAPYLWRTS